MQLIEVSTPVGKLKVDITDEVCLKYGFKYGDVIETCFGEEAVVMGVTNVPAGRNCGKIALFYRKDDGKAYYFKPGNLRNEGFRLKNDKK